MSDYDSDNEMPFTVDMRGYYYEAEYTEEELLQREKEWVGIEGGKLNGMHFQLFSF